MPKFIHVQECIKLHELSMVYIFSTRGSTFTQGYQTVNLCNICTNLQYSTFFDICIVEHTVYISRNVQFRPVDVVPYDGTTSLVTAAGQGNLFISVVYVVLLLL